jgi:hypothetical protein
MNFVSYSKALQSLNSLLDSSPAVPAENPFSRSSTELASFYDLIKNNEALKRIFRSIMENLISSSPRNAIFFVEKLNSLVDKNPVVIYLLGKL